MFRIGDKVTLSHKEFGVITVGDFGTMVVYKVEEDPNSPGVMLVWVKGGHKNITVESDLGLRAKNFILVGPRNKITINTRRRW